MAVTKTIPWQDNSGDNITLSAEQWSGTQTVTLSTPENFGAYRSLNIVFYSKTDSTKSATLRCNQAAATLSFNATEVVWNSDESNTKTITLSTNVSSIAGIQISLSGTYANKYTLGSVSALSNGRASFTITPIGTNQTQTDFDATIEVVLGRLGTYSIPITQYGESVVSEEYTGIKILGSVGQDAVSDVENYYIQNTPVSQISQIPASSFPLTAEWGYAVLLKKITYSSGRVQTIQESIKEGGTLEYTLSLNGANNRFTKEGTVDDPTGEISLSLNIESLGTTITARDEESTLSVNLAYSSGSIQVNSTYYVEFPAIQENEVEGPATGTTPVLTKVSGLNSLAAANGSNTLWNYRATGIARFTSGATESGWNFPVTFSESVSWLSTSNYVAGTLQKGISNSTIIFTATSNANSNTSRSATVTIKLPTSLGGATLGTATLTQEAGITAPTEVRVEWVNYASNNIPSGTFAFLISGFNSNNVDVSMCVQQDNPELSAYGGSDATYEEYDPSSVLDFSKGAIIQFSQIGHVQQMSMTIRPYYNSDFELSGYEVGGSENETLEITLTGEQLNSCMDGSELAIQVTFEDW